MTRPASFYVASHTAKKILAIEDPALGDSIHLLPALKLLREAYAHSELHVVAGPPALFGAVAPWIDRVWPEMPRQPLDNLPLMRQLRRERIDAVFCFSSHNRANLLANLIGARWRAGRRSDHNKPWWWQPLLFTHTVDHPWHLEPMFLQHWHVAKGFGLPGDRVDFGARVLPDWYLESGLRPEDRKTYVHISPYYVYPGKELPTEQYVDLLTRLHRRYDRIILSCAPKERESSLVRELVQRLPFQPYKVFAGSLSVNQYIALVDGARLHLSGDSGGLHVARMVGTPSVSWYRWAWDYQIWAPGPTETAHRVVVTKQLSEKACLGIANDDLLAAAQELIGTA